MLRSLFCLLLLSTSCYGGTATITDLPNPAQDDRPAGSPPELPRAEVALPPDAQQTPTRVVSQSDDLQSAIDDAKPGDVIALQPGVVFHGTIVLPKKSGDAWVTIRTNTAAFPARGTRVTPADAHLMAVVESDNESAIRTEAGAHHYRFVGIEIRPKPATYIYNLALLGKDAKSADDLPHDLVFERCYVHGDPAAGGTRGMALNAANVAIVDSYFADFKAEGEDTQAICGWNGTGPFSISNNYLEAAGENIMFGGADPDVVNLVPSDITIRGNTFSKPLQWRDTKSPWTVKNLLELKNAHRVLIEANLFQYNWPQAQNGYAILFTPRNQDGNAPWAMVRDVTFRKNTVRHVSSGINILGTDDIRDSQLTKRIAIRDNVFEDVSGANWDGIGNLVQVLKGAADVTVDHNTAFETNAAIVASGDPNPNFTFTNNIVRNGVYGIGGDNYYGDPLHALNAYFPGAIVRANAIQGAWPPDYPAGNFFPATMDDIGFDDYAAGDYRLQRSSPYRNAGTDGKDIGADVSATSTPSKRRAVH